MRVQIVLEQPNLDRFGISCRQGLTKLRIFFLGALRPDSREPLSGQGLNGGQQRAGAVPFVGIMLLAHLIGGQRKRLKHIAY